MLEGHWQRRQAGAKLPKSIARESQKTYLAEIGAARHVTMSVRPSPVRRRVAVDGDLYRPLIARDGRKVLGGRFGGGGPFGAGRVVAKRYRCQRRGCARSGTQLLTLSRKGFRDQLATARSRQKSSLDA